MIPKLRLTLPTTNIYLWKFQVLSAVCQSVIKNAVCLQNVFVAVQKIVNPTTNNDSYKQAEKNCTICGIISQFFLHFIGWCPVRITI